MGACLHIAGVECDNCRTDRDYWGRAQASMRPTANPIDYLYQNPKPNRVHETMTRVLAGIYAVRVWRAVDKATQGPDREVAAAIRQASPTFAGLTAALDALTDVAAYEILDANGNGALVYPDWK